MRRLIAASVIAVALAALVIADAARAESGADALLEAVSAKAGGNAAAAQAFGLGAQANNMFMIQFISAWQSQKSLPYEMNAWATQVVKGQFEDAAHLWTAIQPVIPAEFLNDAKAAQLYCLWKLDVPQTFFNRYVELLREPSFSASRAAAAFESTVATQFDGWLIENAIFPTEEQIAVIEALGDQAASGTRVSLQALAALRKGSKGQPLLERIPLTNALAIPLAQAVSLALIRKGDLPAAARVFKLRVEPALNHVGDPHALARHYLAIARLLYQAGSLDGAEAYYEKIPSGTQEFLTAREELDWVWLRKGDTARLRGELKTLSLGLFDEKFAPEVYLVRAISNLKLCYYDQAEKDFQAFLKTGKHWAATITTAVAAKNPRVPAVEDFYSRLADLAVKKRTEEIPRLEILEQRSISTALPAVGPQKHWTDARDRVKSDLEIARKRQAAEYRRQWGNQKAALAEAIRKMKFVKVELMSQLRTAQLTEPQSSDLISTAAAAPVRQAIRDADLSFPFDGVVWTDELFKLRGIVQGKCLGSH